MEGKISDLRFEALRNAIYHTARRLFLDRCNKVLTLVIILAGASAIGQLGIKFGIADRWFGFVAAIAGMLQLVFDFGVKARDHEFLQRRFYDLLAKAAEKPSPTDNDVAQWDAELQRLYGEEPPPLRALDAIAYNAACDSLGKHHARIRIEWWQSLFRHIHPFHQTSFKEDKRTA